MGLVLPSPHPGLPDGLACHVGQVSASVAAVVGVHSERASPRS